MTLQQIYTIKKRFSGLQLNTSVTGMFDNKNWACVFKICFLTQEEMGDLLNHLNEINATYFFGTIGIHIQ